MTTATLPRPAERIAILSLLLVFLCGGVLGAVVMSCLRPLHGTQPTGLIMSTKEWQQQLNLSADQNRQLTSILDDFSHYYDNLLSDGNTRILQILNPDQKQKYERMIRDHRK